MANLALDSISKTYLDCWLELSEGTFPGTSNQPALSMPYQRWFKFKEAFAPSFVVETIQALPYRPQRCLDPFGGSGTTALTCQFLGINSATIEANPFLADLIQSKLCMYDVPQLRLAFRQVLRSAKVAVAPKDLKECFLGAPDTFVQPGEGDRWIFSREVAQAIVALRSEINRVVDLTVRRFLRVMLGSKLVELSNVIVNGKGRRYRRSWGKRATNSEAVFSAFEEACLIGIADIESFSRRPHTEYSVLYGDARELVRQCGSVDFVLTSPPYPNSFDYTDIYNIELWALGYLTSGNDNRTLRETTIRSHVQIAHGDDLVDALTPALRSTYTALVKRRGYLWNRRIPEMVCQYFEDIRLVLLDCRKALREEGYLVMAVGNSRYSGVLIDVPKILSGMISELGFELIKKKAIRSMRTSAQQGGRRLLNESLLWFK
jgi:hypothetical protein